MALDGRVDPDQSSPILESRFHPPGDVCTQNTSSSGAQATATAAAGVGGQKRVVTGFFYSVAGTGLTPANAILNIIDGDTGGTTKLLSVTIGVPADGTQQFVTGLNLIGSANTKLTIEFAALFTSAVESVGVFSHFIGGTGA